MEIDVGSIRCMAPSLGIPPSRHYDPSDAEDAALRLDWARFLFRAGYRLRYPQETTGTAVLLFHRFLIQERVGKHQRSRDVILTTCLFLAGKVTEAPRRLRDVINVLHMLTCTGQDEPPLLDKAYWTMKERIVEFEQVLLRTINFQVDPPDPYRLLLNYARSLRLGRAATRTAWGLANDVLFCPRALSAPPPAVACAAIRMAARVHGTDRRLRTFCPPIRKKRRRVADDDRGCVSRDFGGGGDRFDDDDAGGEGAAAAAVSEHGGGGGGGGGAEAATATAAAAAAAAADDVFVVGSGDNGSSGGGGGGGRSSGGSGGDGGKDDEREVMPWWELFDARDDEIEMVCSELLALYHAHDAIDGNKGIGGRSDGGGGRGGGG
ncbi:unnamed protein product, partial [Laminaria digitata]